MPGFFLREFDCTYCGQPFTMMEGDMILPIPTLCDACLKQLWHLEDTAFEELDKAGSLKFFLEGLRQQWETLEALLEDRAQARGE